jgi:hypothetical protein
MRLIIPLWLSIIVLLINLQQSIIYSFFKANQTNIATEQCEMRELEGNSCQGSCVLRELLAPVPIQEESPFLGFDLKVDEFVGSCTDKSLLPLHPFMVEPLFLFLSSITLHSLVFKIWRPPQLVV